MRSRPVDYTQVIKNVVEDYPNGPWHGLQKDAIQNSWDARNQKKGGEWRVEFDFISKGKDNKSFFVIQDFGTTGLTGDKIADDFEELRKIPDNEKWAKFECYGATKNSIDQLGSRGQGKFLFIHASKRNGMFYDSFRRDKTYRFGMTENFGANLECWNEEDAKSKIIERTGLRGISEPGSRIIIAEPKEDFIKYYNKGDFLRAIEETWWPLIKKFNINIILKKDGEEFAKAEVPKLFNKITALQTIEELKNVEFQYGTNSLGGIKHLSIAYVDSVLPEEFVGITIFREGMKVLNIRFNGSFEYNKKIFGYAEFEAETDSLLRDVETPNHYGFKKEPLWNCAEDRIRSQLRLFAEEKLGIGKKEHKEKVDAQRNRKVISLMNDVLIKLGVSLDLTDTEGPPSPPPPPPPKDNPKSPQKDPCIYDDKVFYPEPYVKRIPYGELLECTCQIKNGTSKKLRIKIGIYSKTKEIYSMKDALGKDKTAVRVKKRITRREGLGKGEYTIRFQLIDESDKQILDEKAHRFWIEEYPPGKSPFKITHAEFPDEKNEEEWSLDYGNKELTINIKHSYYKYLMELEEDYFLDRHKGEICSIAAIYFVIKNIESGSIKKEVVIKNSPLFKGLLANDDGLRVSASLRVQGQIRDILYGSKN